MDSEVHACKGFVISVTLIRDCSLISNNQLLIANRTRLTPMMNPMLFMAQYFENIFADAWLQADKEQGTCT